MCCVHTKLWHTHTHTHTQNHKKRRRYIASFVAKSCINTNVLECSNKGLLEQAGVDEEGQALDNVGARPLVEASSRSAKAMGFEKIVVCGLPRHIPTVNAEVGVPGLTINK